MPRWLIVAMSLATCVLAFCVGEILWGVLMLLLSVIIFLYPRMRH